MDGMTLEKLQVIIQAQIKEYTDAMNKVQQQTNKTVKVVERQTSKIKSALGKIGRVVGVALSVAALVNFGKACIDLGSDLAEVQNVVDVTFQNLNKSVNEFAQSAIERFGLSELAAKKYASTMGAMLKSMGFATDAAAEMSMTLTGLSGDMASFYNLSGDDAFAKIRAGISGETEPLKQLGINLNIANLEAFALSKGMTKAYSAMSQQEQALLRYNYLLSVTADAQGDFARTSDSWANQTKILAERFNQLKAIIGQGLINVLTPVIKVLNQIIAKLIAAANLFKQFTELITGKKSESISVSVGDVATDAKAATGAVGGLTKATKAAGSAAKKAEEAYSGLASFDEVHTLSKNESSASGGGGGGADGLGDIGNIGGAFGDAAAEGEGKLHPVLQKLLDKLKELRDIFMEGFKAGMGDVTLEPLKEALAGIKKSLTEIFTDPRVLKAADNWAKTVAYSLGQITGATAAIGIAIATNIFGGLNRYLAENKERIIQHIVSVFDISSEAWKIAGNFAQAMANIISVIMGENGQRVTAALIGIFANANMGIIETCMKLSRDALDAITRPFIDNQESFKSTIDATLGVIATNLETIKTIVDDTMTKIGEVYDEHVKPMFEAFAEGLSWLTEKWLGAYQQYILPVLDEVGGKFKSFAEEHLQPTINSLLELIGKIADAVSEIWQQILVPFIGWIIDTVAPIIAEKIGLISDILFDFLGIVADIINSVIKFLGGLIDFVSGVLTGDWSKAWEGIKTIFSSIWAIIKSIVNLAITAIAGIISTVIFNIKATVSIVLDAIKTVFSNIFEAIKNKVLTIFNSIKSFISSAITAVKTKISTTLDSIKTTWNLIWNAVSTTTITILNSIKSFISNTIESIHSGISTALNNISSFWGSMWKGMEETVVTIFNGIWNTIKGVINSILGGIEKMANGVVKGLNKVVNAMNNLSFDIPEWVPEFGGKTFGFDIPTISEVSLPRLARGGIVDGPTAAIIGEAGKEAVMPLEHNTGWINDIAAKLGEIISVNLQNILKEYNSDGETVIQTIVKLDTKTLVEQTDSYKKRKGYRLVTE